MAEIKFNVARTEKQVRVTVQPFGNVNLCHWFTRDFEDVLSAEAFYRLIRDGMAERVLCIRKDAYLRGYRDGRAKRAIDEPVYDCINTEEEPRP